MTQRTFFLIAAAVFSLIALGHAIRLLFGWHVMVRTWSCQFWLAGQGLLSQMFPTRVSGWADVYEVS